MKKIFVIFLCDLKRRIKSPLAVILMMLIPLVMTLLIGIVFGGQGEQSLPAIKVLLVDNDGGIIGEFLKRGMQQDTLAAFMDLVPVDSEEGTRMMEDGEASALIEIPKGFTSDFLDRKKTAIRLVKNPAEAFLPMIVEEMVETISVLLDRAGAVFAGPISGLRGVFEADGWPSMAEIEGILDSSRDGIVVTAGYISGDIITYGSETAEEDGDEESGFNIFAYVLPGSLIFGLLFISEITLRDLVRERGTGTLRRIMAAPLRAAHVVAGKVMVTYCITGAACLMIFIIGALGFKIDMGNPLPLAVHFFGVILMCTGLMTFFYGFISSERAADAVMSVVIIVMALFGGSMIPFEQLGATLQKIGRFSPVYWAGDGFFRIFLFKAGLNDIAVNLIVVYGLGLATLLPGGYLLEKKMGRGG